MPTASTTPLEQAAPPLRVSMAAGAGKDDDVAVDLVGRRPECSRLDELLDAIGTGRSDVLVVRGDAGIGKTALLAHLCRRASGCAVASVTAVPSEQDLDFAALDQLCRPLMGLTERLPKPQRAALRTALGLAGGVAPDRFFVGLAVRNLLAEAGADRPLVCVIDDAQWLDAASSSVLGFVSRRLGRERVALAFGVREPGPGLAGLPELSVGGLAHHDAHALLRTCLHSPLDDRVRERLIAEADGNPGALLAVTHGSAPTWLAGGFGDPDAGGLTTRGAAMLTRGLATLDAETRLLLLVAAAEPLGEPLLLWRAAEDLSIPPTAADAAEDAGVLEIGTRVRFREPLVRAAVYRSATSGNRRRAHRALARATDPHMDPERRAWHRARGATAPDDDIAGDLERSAERAARRGGLAAAAVFLRRAAALTPEPADRARRALAAADTTRQAGDADHALQVLFTAETAPLDALGRARAALIRARVAADARADDAVHLLHAVARRLRDLDVDLAREAYLDALGATVILGSGADVDPVAIARDALATRRDGPPRPVDLLLEGLALRLTDGAATAAPTLRGALAAFRKAHLPVDVALGWGWLAAYVAAATWDHATHVALAERLAHLSRQDGALATLPHTLANLSTIHLRQGELARASVLMREADAAVLATRSELPMPVATLMAAYRGREAEVWPLIGGASEQPAEPPRGLGAVIVQLAGVLLCNGLGRYEDALRVGRTALDDPEPVGTPPWVLPELVEAAVRAGAAHEAAAALDRLCEHARVSGSDWALGLEARSRALLATGKVAERLHREAIERLARPGSRVDLARAQLVYGEWLRREGRRVDARVQLRDAHDRLSAMGIEGFAERARRELRATGETARKRTMETRDDLTAQELEIARLARQGLSNQQIGAQLFISPRTAEWHLRKVFAKVGITSRVALRDALPDDASAPA
jgi:DNA-binding CsgD family transcriptional regulator